MEKNNMKKMLMASAIAAMTVTPACAKMHATGSEPAVVVPTVTESNLVMGGSSIPSNYLMLAVIAVLVGAAVSNSSSSGTN